MGCGTSEPKTSQLPIIPNENQSINSPLLEKSASNARDGYSTPNNETSSPITPINPAPQKSNVENKPIPQEAPPSRVEPPQIETPKAVGVKDNTTSAYSLILCGAGESGKTTFTRQMKLKFLGEFSQEERSQFIATIRGNLVETMQILLTYLERHGEKPDEDVIEHEQTISDISAFECDFNVSLVESLSALWNDPVVQNAFQHRDETAIPDHMDYFYSKIEELVDDEYVPTNEDILKARIRTIGFDAITFNLEGAMIRIFDVGGQKNERSTWAKVMNDVESCIFCVSFADFDKPMFEDPNVLRIHDSLNTFQDISKNPKFSEGPIFLLCNKFDSFQQKIKNSNKFVALFPDFSGNSHDPDACAEYLIQLFQQRGGPAKPERPIIPYKISALNPNDVVDVANKICQYISTNYYE